MVALVLRFSLYCALFWIQGKTDYTTDAGMTELYCALFWIQGKTCAGESWIPGLLYCALFWIQGKTLDRREGAIS